MNLNRRDLRKLSFDFNSIANRLLRSSHNEFIHVLKKFIGYVNSEELIKEYIISCTREGFDVISEINRVNTCHGRSILDLGYTDEEEVYTIYSVLIYIAENGFNLYGIGRAYSSKSNYNEIIKDFNEKFSCILINYISGYLTKIGIEMGIDEEVNYMITNNGGQVNISKDMSTLNAVQNIGTKSEELINLVEEINKLVKSSEVPDEQREMIEESVDTIKNELQADSPKKGLIKSCITGLKATVLGIPTAIELCISINEFIEFVSSKV